MLNKIFKIFLLTSGIIFLVISCSDDPTSIGIDLLPNKDFIDIFTVNSDEGAFAQESKTYTDSLDLTSSSVLHLGKHDNIQSTMLMKFFIFLPDSIKDPINNGTFQVLNSTIELVPIYTYADKSNYFDFSLHEINSSWSSLTFNKDSLANLNYENIDVSSNRIYADNLITLDFDKELTQEWLKYSASGEQVGNNNGLYFNFDPSSNKVVGFPAISYEDGSKLTKLTIVIEVPGNFIDTVVVPVTSDVHVVLGDLPTGNPENIFIQGGIAVRSNFMIDVSLIPDNTIINKATLNFSYDETESLIGSKTSDSLGAITLTDYASNTINETLQPALFTREGMIYSGDITRFVQSWVSEQENNGLQLFLVNEITTVNKVALKGALAADSSARPYLEVIYTAKR